MNQVASLSILWQAEVERKKLKPLTIHQAGPEGRIGSLREIMKVRVIFWEKSKSAQNFAYSTKILFAPSAGHPDKAVLHFGAN